MGNNRWHTLTAHSQSTLPERLSKSSNDWSVRNIPRMGDITDHAINNNLAIARAVQQVVTASLNARPKNTRRNYTSKQTLYVQWCNDHQFVDGSVVTEGKILLFLNEVVLPRGSGRQVAGVMVPLSAEGLEGYVKALVDLYSTQQSLGAPRHPHPRGKALREFLKSQKRMKANLKRTSYADRGSGTIQDTYNVEELRRVASHYLELRTGRGLRDRMDLLLGHALMARGESTRKIQFPDLFSMPLKDEGPTNCVATMVIMDQGKINQFGRIEYGGCIRHRDAELCPVGALALYLFWRFQCEGEPFPDMNRREDWYDTHLVNGKDPKKEISYSSQARGLKNAMRHCGIISGKVSQ